MWKNLAALLVLATGSLLWAQDNPNNVVPNQAAIVWTGMQQPVPEPAQDLAAREIPPAQQGAEQQTERSPEQREQPGVQKPGQAAQQTDSENTSRSDKLRTITGTVVKENGGYFLRGDGNSEYQLDDVSKVRDFENQAVRITGTIDSSTRTIHVQTIAPAT